MASVAQEAFARALARWRHIDAPEAWVRRVALRLATGGGRPAQPDPGTSTELSRALMRLPMQQRQVLVLFYLAGVPVDEIAGDCGLSAGEVRIRLAAAKRRLDQELGQKPELAHSEQLRSSLADVVTEAARWGAPDVGVLRQRVRRRALRLTVSGAAALAVLAGTGLGISTVLSGSAPVAPVARAASGPQSPASRNAGSQSAQAPGNRLGTWSPAGQLTSADAGPAMAPWTIMMGGPPSGLAYVDNAVTNAQTGAILPPNGLTYIGAALAGDDHRIHLHEPGRPALRRQRQRE